MPADASAGLSDSESRYTLQHVLASRVPTDELYVFKLSVNVKTAKALGLTIPRTVLLRADEVIQ